MRVTVHLYGNLKRFAPAERARAEIELPDGSSLRDLFMRLEIPDASVWMAAVNDTVVQDSTALHEGDVVEVFEPVGGGACV